MCHKLHAKCERAAAAGLRLRRLLRAKQQQSESDECPALQAAAALDHNNKKGIEDNSKGMKIEEGQGERERLLTAGCSLLSQHLHCM